MRSCSFNFWSNFCLSSESQSHSGYSLSSKATGSSPFFLILRFNTVPAGTEDFTWLSAGTDVDKSLVGVFKLRKREDTESMLRYMEVGGEDKENMCVCEAQKWYWYMEILE